MEEVMIDDTGATKPCQYCLAVLDPDDYTDHMTEHIRRSLANRPKPDEAKQLGAALGEGKAFQEQTQDSPEAEAEHKKLMLKKLEEVRKRCDAAEIKYIHNEKIRRKTEEELRRKNEEELRRKNDEELSRQRLEELKTKREKKGNNPKKKAARLEENDRDDSYDVDSIVKEIEETGLGKTSGEGSVSENKKTKQKTGRRSRKDKTGKKEIVEKGHSFEDTQESLKNEDVEAETDLPENTAEEIRLKENEGAKETVKAVKQMTEAADPEEERTEASSEKTKNLAASEKIEAGEKEAAVYDILLEGLKQVHTGYLEALSTSNDDLSAKRLEICTNLAIQLCKLIVVNTASEESSAALLSIVKAGILYAFRDAPYRLSFLTCVVLNFASELPTAGLSDSLKNVEDLAMGLNIHEDSSEWIPSSKWIPYFDFVDVLRKWIQEDEISVGNSESTVRIPVNEIGHVGEGVAYKYFCETCSDKTVFWLNEHRESGHPYDLRLEAIDKSKEYVEVKTTTVADREWFYISPNELAFAHNAGKSYIIAQVDLSDPNNPTVTVHQDFERLLKSKFFKLLVVRGPEDHKGNSLM